MANCCQWFGYILPCVGFLVLWVVELIGVLGRRSILCGVLSSFSPTLSLLPLLSTVDQCDGCLSSQGSGASWLGCQVLPPVSTVSILELAANSGSSRMSQAPNLHRATKLLIIS